MSKKKRETRTCPECGGTMRYETRKDSIAYKGHRKEIDTTAWWCDSCDEAVLDGEALAASEKAFFELRAEVEGVLSPARVATIRGRLGISQREAGELLGGGPRAFQKYESGSTALSVPMSNLLRLLENEPARLKELRALRARATDRRSRGRATEASAAAAAKRRASGSRRASR